METCFLFSINQFQIHNPCKSVAKLSSEAESRLFPIKGVSNLSGNLG